MHSLHQISRPIKCVVNVLNLSCTRDEQALVLLVLLRRKAWSQLGGRRRQGLLGRIKLVSVVQSLRVRLLLAEWLRLVQRMHLAVICIVVVLDLNALYKLFNGIVSTTSSMVLVMWVIIRGCFQCSVLVLGHA